MVDRLGPPMAETKAGESVVWLVAAKVALMVGLLAD